MGNDLKLRRFEWRDRNILFDWRNHPNHRKWSFNSGELIYAEHEKWFRCFLSDPGRFGYIFESANQPIGFIRFDRSILPGTLAISLGIAPDCCGRGYGKRLLEMGMNHPETVSEAAMLRAETLVDNFPSIRLFETAGFKKVHSGTRDGKNFHEWRIMTDKTAQKPKTSLKGESPLCSAAIELIGNVCPIVLASADQTPDYIFRFTDKPNQHVTGCKPGPARPESSSRTYIVENETGRIMLPPDFATLVTNSNDYVEEFPGNILDVIACETISKRMNQQ